MLLGVRNGAERFLPPAGNPGLLKQCKRLLKRELPGVTIVCRTNHVLQFIMREGSMVLEIDNLFFRDFCPGDRSAGQQACGALQFFHDQHFDGFDDDDLAEQSKYSTAFSELAVTWVQMQSPFLKNFIRLAKARIIYSIPQEAYSSATALKNRLKECKRHGVKSCIIEALAVHVARARAAQSLAGATLRMTDLFHDLHRLVQQQVCSTYTYNVTASLH